MCLSLYISLSLYIYIYMYIYIYIYLHVCVCVYIYIYIWRVLTSTSARVITGSCRGIPTLSVCTRNSKSYYVCVLLVMCISDYSINTCSIMNIV